jgi:nitrate/nitrite transport system substrate-binding protein
MWPDHPEKVCAFTEEFAEKNPKTVKAVLKALHLSSEYIDKMENRPAVAEVISRPTYINCPADVILGRLQGKYDYGNGAKEQDPNYMIFSARNCNYPSRTYGYWWLSQFRRWGMVKGAPNYKQIVEKVLRTDIYSEAVKELGVAVTAKDMQPVKLADGVFDPKNAEAYAKGFAVHNVVA